MEDLKFAKPLARLAAYLIDKSIIFVSQMLCVFAITIENTSNFDYWQSQFFQIIIYILLFLPNILYYAFFLPREGYTPGYKFLGLKIIKEKGNVLSGKEAALRAFVHLLPYMELVDSISILFSKKKQGVHDMAVESVCINTEDKEGRAIWVIIGWLIGAVLFLIIPIMYLFGHFTSLPR